MTGEQLYTLYVAGLESVGVDCDPWDALELVDRMAWAATAEAATRLVAAETRAVIHNAEA